VKNVFFLALVSMVAGVVLTATSAVAGEAEKQLLDAAAGENVDLVRTLLDDGASDFDSVVVPLETMEQELSRVWSPVSHLQSVLGSADWREAYNKALPLLTEYGTELAQDIRLHDAYARVAETLDADGPERAIVQHALRDFKLAGVDLPDEQKARFKAIMQELAGVQARFDQNIQDASDAWKLEIDDAAELASYADRAGLAQHDTHNAFETIFRAMMQNEIVLVAHDDDAWAIDDITGVEAVSAYRLDGSISSVLRERSTAGEAYDLALATYIVEVV